MMYTIQCVLQYTTIIYRLRENEMKKKRKFHSQSTTKKDRLKYFELILKKLEDIQSH